jgi:hypothetical protein
MLELDSRAAFLFSSQDLGYDKLSPLQAPIVPLHELSVSDHRE